jgi:hypothetical protein
MVISIAIKIPLSKGVEQKCFGGIHEREDS